MTVGAGAIPLAAPLLVEVACAEEVCVVVTAAEFVALATRAEKLVAVIGMHVLESSGCRFKSFALELRSLPLPPTQQASESSLPVAVPGQQTL